MHHLVQPPTRPAVGEGNACRVLFDSPSGTLMKASVAEQSGGWGESGQMGESGAWYPSVAAQAFSSRGIPQGNRGPVLTKSSLKENPVLLHES